MVYPTFQSGGSLGSCSVTETSATAALAAVPSGVRLVEWVVVPAVCCPVRVPVTPQSGTNAVPGQGMTLSNGWVPIKRVAVVRSERSYVEVIGSNAVPHVTGVAYESVIRNLDAGQDQGCSMGWQHLAALATSADSAVAVAGLASDPQPAFVGSFDLLPEPVGERTSHRVDYRGMWV